MNIGAKHSLCLISMLSKMQPSESIPIKNSLVGLKSRKIWAGSLIRFRRKVGGLTRGESNTFSGTLNPGCNAGPDARRCQFRRASNGGAGRFEKLVGLARQIQDRDNSCSSFMSIRWSASLTFAEKSMVELFSAA